MKILLAEDDFSTRKFMQKCLSKYGDCDVTVDGMEAMEAYRFGLEEEEPYDLVCLDVMMPVLDGYQALKGIRDIEKEKALDETKISKIVMVTALNDKRNVQKAFDLGCDAFSGKPFDPEKFEATLSELGLL